jgi:predicted component of type VI protein secretion system
MRFTMLVALLVLAGCAGNKADDKENVRIRDTTVTAGDTLAPDDTLDRARRAMPDTAGALDTTSRR